MPGFLETTLNQGYDFLSPYVEKAQPYVEKARNNVPLVDPALKKAEELVPILITRADQFAEPHVEKMRPYVEPRVEQVKERVTPYCTEGVKKYGVLRKEGVKYYNVGLEKVEKVKGFKDAKENQIKEFKEARVTQIKEFTDPQVEKIRGFTAPKVEKIKEFKEARVTQIKGLAEPTVEKIKGATEPHLAIITARKQKMQKDLQGLSCESLLGKVASGVEKLEALIDKYAPLTAKQKKENAIDVSGARGSSCVRINRSVVNMQKTIVEHFGVFMLKIMMVLTFPLNVRASYMDGTLQVKLGKFATEMKFKFKSKFDYAEVQWNKLRVTLKGETLQSILLRIKDQVPPTKAKIATKATLLFTQVTEKLAPFVAGLKQTSLFKKVVQTAVISSEKALGKEKTTTILSKAETCTPAAWKAAPPPSPVSTTHRHEAPLCAPKPATAPSPVSTTHRHEAPLCAPKPAMAFESTGPLAVVESAAKPVSPASESADESGSFASESPDESGFDSETGFETGSAGAEAGSAGAPAAAESESDGFEPQPQVVPPPSAAPTQQPQAETVRQRTGGKGKGKNKGKY